MFNFSIISNSSILQSQELTNKDYSVMINVNLFKSPNPAIKINWNLDTNCNYYVVGKKELNSKEWDSIAYPNKHTSFIIDSNVEIGKKYDYFVKRYFDDRIAYNYFSSGIEIPNEEYKGKVMIVIDKSIIEPLKFEIERFKNDLESEGWSIKQILTDRAEQFEPRLVNRIKDYINYEYFKIGNELKSIVLLGRVPVPYSGAYAIDAHIPDHFGAWPSDVFYATFEGEWYDSTENTKDAYRKENWNLPFDGKFDNNVIPSDAIFQVGRIDFYNLPAFKQSEIELLRRYLNKNHNYRKAKAKVNYKSLIDDKFKFYSGEYFASTAWMNFSALLGEKNIDTTSQTIPIISKNNYFFSYGCSGATYDEIGNIISSDYSAKNNVNTVFYSLMGSYFGDWDTKNNILRSLLASEPFVLGSFFNGRPYLWFQHLGIGETIGYSMMISQNNFDTYKANDVWGFRGNHIALMGDPTLRMFNVSPPNEIKITQIGDDTVNKFLQINWRLPIDSNILGINIYKFNHKENKYKKIAFVDKNLNYFIDSSSNVNQFEKYILKTYALITSNTASFYQESSGEIIENNNSTNIEETKINYDNISIDYFNDYIYLNLLNNYEKALFELYGINGIIIDKRELFNNESVIINTNNIVKGVYFIKIKVNSNLFVKKFFVN